MKNKNIIIGVVLLVLVLAVVYYFMTKKPVATTTTTVTTTSGGTGLLSGIASIWGGGIKNAASAATQNQGSTSPTRS